jgi:hypothetical protein
MHNTLTQLCWQQQGALLAHTKYGNNNLWPVVRNMFACFLWQILGKSWLYHFQFINHKHSNIKHYKIYRYKRALLCTPRIKSIIIILKWQKKFHGQWSWWHSRHHDLYIQRWSYPCTNLNRPWGFREVEAPRISWQLADEGGKVVSPTHWLSLLPRKYSWCSFLLEAESTPGP